MSGKGSAVRKRQQIADMNRTVFLWVAGAAAIVGLAGVLSVSLYQRLAFNQKVISAKTETLDNLKNNNAIVDELRGNVRVINTNQALADTPRLDSTEPVSVILDALPSQPNSSALGASLQKKLLGGVSVDSLTVEPIAAESTAGAKSSTGSTGSKKAEINFNFTVSAGSNNIDAIKEVLLNLERSIRVIHVNSLTIEQQRSMISLSVSGVAYYSPEVKVELNTKKVRP